MNVLIIADYSTPMSGNFIASQLELADYLKQHGDMAVFLFRDVNPSKNPWINWIESHGFTVLSMDGQSFTHAQFNNLLNKHGIDLVHSHFLYEHRFLLAHAGKFDRPVRILLHQRMEFPVGKSVFVMRLRYFLYSILCRTKGIGIISVNQKMDEAYRFCGKDRHWFIPNALSLHRYTEGGFTRESFRARYGIGPDETLCFFIGWDVVRKGLDIALQAIRHLNDNGFPILIGIIGFGTRDTITDSDAHKIREISGIDPFSPWIRLMGSEEDMFTVHRSADVFVSASRSEAFSNGILEAISQDVPVVVSDIKGTSWSMAYNRAFSYPTEDPVQCAEMIKKALSSDKSLSNCRQFMSGYDIQRWCEKVYQVYQLMLHARS